jgi:hypothetical protein
MEAQPMVMRAGEPRAREIDWPRVGFAILIDDYRCPASGGTSKVLR